MTKVLRNVLSIALGLLTTVSFAQDLNVESRTRIDMSGDNEKMLTDQRVTTGVTFGGSNWGIYMSNDFNYNLAGGNLGGDPTASIYEAYASTDLMGFATMTVGRQALNYGSGALMSTNDWGTDRTTWDGMKFDLNLDAVSATLGYANRNEGLVDSEDFTRTWVNVSGNFSGFDVNVLFMDKQMGDADDSDGATGIDISGEIAGATVMASLNSDYEGDKMNMFGVQYAINDDMSVMVSQTSYDEDNDGDFRMVGTNMDGSWATTGGLGYLASGKENITIGLSYDMGDVSIGAAMHNITDANDDDYERSATEINLGYSFSDNAKLGISLISDDEGTDADATYTYVTLTVTP
tara:strand:- start:1883 stop:2929 length:1047 start_codon:yes stop_codon:yes gene_type:complete